MIVIAHTLISARGCGAPTLQGSLRHARAEACVAALTRRMPHALTRAPRHASREAPHMVRVDSKPMRPRAHTWGGECVT
eukprot:365693-Chlamydomonas_euryale.AAC.31